MGRWCQKGNTPWRACKEINSTEKGTLEKHRHLHPRVQPPLKKGPRGPNLDNPEGSTMVVDYEPIVVLVAWA